MKSRHLWLMRALTYLAMAFMSIQARAVPLSINYQGMLTDPDGVPVNSPGLLMTFRLYDASIGGTLVWGPSAQSVKVDNGVYNVVLTGLPPNFPDDLFLEVEIAGEGGPMTPRQVVTSVFYAIRAGEADQAFDALFLQGHSASEVLAPSWYALSDIPAGFADGIDDTGITTETDPTVPSAVKDGISWSEIAGIPPGFADGVDNGIITETDPTVAVSVKDGVSWNEISGIPAGFADGVDNTGAVTPPLILEGSASSGDSNWDRNDAVMSAVNTNSYAYSAGIYSEGPENGIFAVATNTGNAYNHGGWFVAKGAHGYGIYAQATNTSGTGTIGGRFQSNGMTGYGIHVQATNAGDYRNYGGYFQSYGQKGMAVYGEAMDATGTDEDDINYGGYFVSNGRRGQAVYGKATQEDSAWNFGGFFEAAGVNGQAVHGYASNTSFGFNFGGYFESAGVIGVGVYGINSASNAAGALGNGEVGVWGRGAGNNNYAGFFVGNVMVQGRTSVEVVEITGGSDLSEQFEVRSHEVDIEPSPGMVVSIDPERPGGLVVSSRAYDRKVAGIISGAGGVKSGLLMGQKGSKADGANSVALTGRVYCFADASNGAIEPGDLLTTSDTPGHAMKVLDYNRAQGAIIGKAMVPLDKGKGLILVLVSLQ